MVCIRQTDLATAGAATVAATPECLLRTQKLYLLAVSGLFCYNMHLYTVHNKQLQ